MIFVEPESYILQTQTLNTSVHHQTADATADQKAGSADRRKQDDIGQVEALREECKRTLRSLRF